MKGRYRAANGNIMLLTVAIACFVILPTIMTTSQIALYYIDRTRSQNCVEAACLLAANDLSRIFIDDPHFGFVSLSNYPPVGKATAAEDGEPLPVIGINTLVGTVRQNTIVAEELGNHYMARLAEEDRTNLDETIKKLNGALSRALEEDKNVGLEDIHGNKIDPMKDVKALLQATLPDNLTVESVEMETGWLQEGTESTQDIPKPYHLARVKPEQIHRGKYKPFINIPAGRHSFTFAGLAANSTQVNPVLFQEQDKKHICSIVRLKCVVSLKNMENSFLSFGLGEKPKITCVACCQPFCLPDIGPKGAMTLRFTSGPVPGLSSWKEFLAYGNFQNSQITDFEVVDGDYPSDPEARMVEKPKDLTRTAEQQFAENLYYWLRNGHTRPNIDAVLSFIEEPFRVNANQIFTYEFGTDGSISRRILAKDPFPVGVTSHSQSQCMVSTQLHTGVTPVIIFRNDVKALGTQSGGKHAGQPLNGFPLNWCEIPEYGGDEHLARGLGKGRLGTHLTLFDPFSDAPADETTPGYGLFRSFDGKEIQLQPRKSFYSGGLALDIEIGGFRPTTQDLDVERMMRVAGRREI